MILVFFFASVLLSCLPFIHSATNHNTSIPICPKSFTCPNLEPFSYPFYNANDTQCGLIKVNCTSNGTNLNFRGDLYEVGGNYRSDSRPSVLVLVLNKKFEKLVNDKKCEALEYNFTSPSPLMYSSSITPFTNVYKCTNNTNYAEEMDAYFNQSTYNRYTRCKPYNFYYKSNISDTTVPTHLPPICEIIQLPVNVQFNRTRIPDKTDIFSLLGFEFTITFNLSSSCNECRNKDGQCDTRDGHFQCLGTKKRKPNQKTAETYPSSRWICVHPHPLYYGSIFFGVSVFSYTELEDATQNFDPSQELGNGGFGAVYYGKLQDGREVAVKRLYEHNYKRVQQFVNEIRILTRLRHPNLVVLYGCTSRQSHELLLVYEYISNGTVADHLHGKQANSSLLTWPLRMNIAIETARALVYLHASEIIHRDVKTSNILLDQNFSAKVADFGLSRLLPNDVTHVSTAPQGTPGYVDPQYHHCYQLTDKSDVYSFGVVLIELISSMVAVDLSRSQDEISLADLALNRIQRCALDQLIDPDLGSDSDAEIMRMITSVAELAFQCLQYYSEMRPTMSEVLDVLEDIQAPGRIDSIKPPTPSETSDKTVLLKDFLPSPVSVTGEWHSESTVSTTLSIR
ncbi:unnamed protein product [Lactuca virosa]|uniref:Protein kinase domain-containing protein n=1 Tax=Lactuca virosa TaxID=75947 RepID=A0AAU9LWR4_9ASTR|nr:unnamed protein product [Lactuca virosa]